MNNYNKPNTTNDESVANEKDWDMLSSDKAERQQLKERVLERFNQPGFKKCLNRALTSMIMFAAGAGLVSRVGMKLNTTSSSQPEIRDQSVEVIGANSFTKEEDSTKDNTSIYWVNDSELRISLKEAPENFVIISADQASDTNTYKEKLGVDDETAASFIEQYNELVRAKQSGPRTLLDTKPISTGDNVPADKHAADRYKSDLDTRLPYSKDEKELGAYSFENRSEEYISLREENDKKIDNIVEELELERTNDVLGQVENCRKVATYIVEHNKYDDKALEEKQIGELMIEKDLRNALIEERGVCSSFSVEFEAILERVGMDVKTVSLATKDGGAHACNLVKIGDKYYYFDTTSEMSLFETRKKEDSNTELILCFAGLGKEEYEEFYTPMAILNRNFEPESIPENIAEERIPPMIANGLFDPNK